MRVDTHCHLDYDDYDNLENVIKKMENNIMIASGVNKPTNINVLKLCTNYENIYATIGIHPEYASYSDDTINDTLDYIEKSLLNPKVVGIGEIGLDYHYSEINKDKQKEILIKQLDLARKYNKTVVIHSRDSAEDTYNILKDYKDLKKTIHCYSYSLEMAKKFIDINCMLGIGGVLTFKNSSKLKEVVEGIDIKYILLETDSPYLAPEPIRGTINEPYNTIYIADKIAQIKGVILDEVLEQTTNNAFRQFDLKKAM